MFIFGLFPPIFWVLFVGYVALWYRVFVQGRGGYWLFRDYGWLTALYAASEGFVFNPPRLLDLLIPIEYKWAYCSTWDYVTLRCLRWVYPLESYHLLFTAPTLGFIAVTLLALHKSRRRSLAALAAAWLTALIGPPILYHAAF